VPDRRPAAVDVVGALDLVAGGGRAEEEALGQAREVVGGHGFASLGSVDGSGQLGQRRCRAGPARRVGHFREPLATPAAMYRWATTSRTAAGTADSTAVAITAPQSLT